MPGWAILATPSQENRGQRARLGRRRRRLMSEFQGIRISATVSPHRATISPAGPGPRGTREEVSVASDRKTERHLSARLRVAARGGGSGIGGGRRILSAPLHAAARGSRILGANDRVVLASIGVRGQGNSLKRGFAS